MNLLPRSNPLRWIWLLPALGLMGCGSLTNPVPMRPAMAEPPQALPTPNIENAQKASALEAVKSLQAQSQHYAALAHLQAYHNRWGNSPESQIIQAQSLMATGQDAAARLLYQNLSHGELAGTAQHGLGLLAARQGQLDEAIQAFGQAAQLLPTDPIVLGDWGYALLQRGRWVEARTPLLTAAELAPEDSRSLANLALYHFKTGDSTLAERVLASPHISAEARQRVRAMTGSSPPRETDRPPAR